VWAAAAVVAASLLVAAVAFRMPRDPRMAGPASPPGPAARVEARIGPVRLVAGPVAGESPGRELGPGDGIPLGTTLETLGSGRLALRLASGHALRIDEATSIRIFEPGVVTLSHGRLYVDSGPVPDPRLAVSIRTSLGDVTEEGTQFEVSVDAGSLRVRLREGRAAVRAAQQVHLVEARQELTLLPDGTVTRRAIPADDPIWSWILPLTPFPDFEGRSAATFLEWMARERGWSLVYADEPTARAARTTVLHGSFPHLRFDDALAAAMLASQLEYRLENGVLTCARPATDRGMDPL
jgi:ferric-dicitrate binding protein FerR (iron transport regulator)